MATHLQLRAAGQIRSWVDGAGDSDGFGATAWQNVLRLTQKGLVGYTQGDAGVQDRPKFADETATIDDSPTLHNAFTPAFIICHVSLGYALNDAGVIQSFKDALQYARFRIVTGRSGGYTVWEEFDDVFADSALTVYANMPTASVAGLGLPPKTVVPVFSDMANGDGNYTVAFSRRAILPVKAAAFPQVSANAGWEIQMRTTTQNSGFEYDVMVSGDYA